MVVPVYGSRLEASPSIGFVRKNDLSGLGLVRLLASDQDQGAA